MTICGRLISTQSGMGREPGGFQVESPTDKIIMVHPEHINRDKSM